MHTNSISVCYIYFLYNTCVSDTLLMHENWCTEHLINSYSLRKRTMCIRLCWKISGYFYKFLVSFRSGRTGGWFSCSASLNFRYFFNILRCTLHFLLSRNNFIIIIIIIRVLKIVGFLTQHNGTIQGLQINCKNYQSSGREHNQLPSIHWLYPRCS